MQAPAQNAHRKRVEWIWPVDVERYDRSPKLQPIESALLKELLERFTRGAMTWPSGARATLERLLLPVHDALDYTGASGWTRTGTATLLMRQMHNRSTTFWAWDEGDWLEIFAADSQTFMQKHGRSDEHRLQLVALAYLLCNFQGLDEIGRYIHRALANKVFGQEPVDAAVDRVCKELFRWGYGQSIGRREIPKVVCAALLRNRSPLLEDLSTLILAEVRAHCAHDLTLVAVHVSRALANLGCIDTPLALERKPRPDLEYATRTRGVPDVWLQWCERWRDTSTYTPRSRNQNFSRLLMIGRWLAARHADVASPADWTRETAADWVAAVDRMLVGEWTATYADRRARRLNQPLLPKTKASHLTVARAFFHDCQEWGWIPRRFHPGRAFELPRSVRRQIGPDPRVLADDLWPKLLWAGLNLTARDVAAAIWSDGPSDRSALFYPIEMVRALAIVWLFAGLRSDEIRRLRVGAVRWQHEDVRISGGDDVLPKDVVCFLSVPVNKTSPAFVKPVDRPVGEAIAAWEAVRPSQPRLADRKTGELADFLFAYRGRLFGSSYLNLTLIPILCHKAGVPEQDARGDITSHRARSTIASMLANAKEPLGLFDLMQWMGHRSPNSTLQYLKSSPTRLAKVFASAEYFERNLRSIDVLVPRGKTAQVQTWRYDLGHGYCRYEFFAQCPHRLACARCDYYEPKDSQEVLVLEAEGNLVRLRQDLLLTDEEREAIDGDVVAFQRLRSRRWDIATPSGPTPRQMEHGLDQSIEGRSTTSAVFGE
jgi:Phage integrase family